MIRPQEAVNTATAWESRTWAAPLADETYRQQVWGRILASVAVSDAGCWEWSKSRTEDGYGSVSVKRRMVNTHQVALAISRGSLWPPDLQVDHLCRNRRCCNPDHLELVTPQENSRRGLAGFVSGLRQRRKTSCPKGHPYDEANTYVRPGIGSRRCRTCRADGMRGKPQWRDRDKSERGAA